MNEQETFETSVVTMEESPAAEGATIPAEETGAEPRIPADLTAQADALKAVYPDFDLDAALDHPILGGLLRGEGQPTLRQLYEAVCWEDISAERVRAAVDREVSRVVESAVKESEERLLSHIRARGQRPAENGVTAAVGIRMHPAVERLTRRERAMLAKRAEDGETIRL